MVLREQWQRSFQYGINRIAIINGIKLIYGIKIMYGMEMLHGSLSTPI